MPDNLEHPGDKLESLLRELGDARERVLERRYPEPAGCPSFTRLMRILQKDLRATKEETEHLSVCHRCKRSMDLARPHLPVLPPMNQTSLKPEMWTGELLGASAQGTIQNGQDVDAPDAWALPDGAPLGLRPVLARAIECIAAALQKPVQEIKSACLGWSDPFPLAASAATGSIELDAELPLGMSGRVHLEINPFGAVFLRSEFDQPTAVTVLLVNLQIGKPVELVIDGGASVAVTLAARTTVSGFAALAGSLNARELELVVLAPEVQP